MKERCDVRNDALQRCTRVKGHDGEHKAPKPRGTTLRNVRIDDDRWQALGELATDEGTDRSALIRQMIDERLTPQPQS